ncbi:hypothetical protein JCM11641_003465 [Rhodosporidiobolus odoratus]
MSWLRQLPRHPIFALPPTDSPSSLNPASNPSIPPLNRTTSARQHELARSHISQSASSKSLFGISSPSSNKSSRLPSSSSARKLTAQTHEGPVKGGRKSAMIVVRGNEVVVAVGKELRMASLADVKARCNDKDGPPSADIELGDYKILNTPAITFEVQQLVLNSTSKLLAVVGAHSVVVIDLPRKGWTNSVGRTLECRALPVGKFYHSLPGSPLVAQVLWHPLGEHASSLLVLTADAALRDYTINEDVEEPAQTVSFVRKPEKESGTRYGFSAEDQDASRAVGMTVGEGKGDWGPLTLYALMRNGDIVSLCPFLPKKAFIPPSYIHSLSAFVSAKVDYLSTADTTSSALTRFDPSASTTSSTPSKALTSSRASVVATPTSSAHSRAPPALSKRYNLQLQYVNSLVRQATASKTATTTLNGVESGDVDSDLLSDERSVRIVAPSRSDFTPSLQGPFLLQPAPAEIDNGAESRACDIAYLQYAAPSPAQEGKEGAAAGGGIGVLALAYSDGKVDLCIEVEKVEARWVGEESLHAGAAAGARSTSLVLARSRRGGFGLDEEEDAEEADDEDGLEGLPTLAVYETIDLGLADEVNPSNSDEGEKEVARALEDNHPTFVRDPLYPDTLYLHHALGVHCLLLSPWLTELASATMEMDGEEEDEEKLQKEVEKTLKGQVPTEVLWVLKTLSSDAEEQATPPMVGLQVINDVYLGYSLLLLTSSLQLVGVELSLRVDSTGSEDPTSPAPLASSTSAPHALPPASPAYVSLLDTPFTTPPLLSRSRTSGVSALARLAPNPGGSKEISITPDTLRQLGKHVSTVQTSVRELVEAADLVQHRLELQMKELSRQLGKLAELKALRNDLGKSTSASMEGSTEARLRRVEETQRRLVERTDRVLQRLMEQHQPEISAYERKWCDELGRLEKQVQGGSENGYSGGGGGAGSSLETRARRVEAQFEALRPAMEEMRRRETLKEVQEAERARAREGTPRKGEMGREQVKALEGKLADEAKLIADARRKVERLTSSLAATSLA